MERATVRTLQARPSFRVRRLWWAPALTALVLLGGLRSRARVFAQELTAVHVTAGWNIVAAPTGTVISGAVGPLFASGTDSNGYQTVHPGEIVGGRAVWANFSSDTVLMLDHTASKFTRVLAPPNQWVLIGNPSTTATLPINGANAAVGYDTARGYYPVTQLDPGEGAWVLVFAGGDVTIGTAPAGGSADAVRKIQQGLTANAADASFFGMIPPIATELISANRLDELQSMMDDIRSSFQDGLAIEHTAPLPVLNTTQVTALQEMRRDLSSAQDMAGGSSGLIAEAQKQAQIVEDQGKVQARAGSGTVPNPAGSSVPAPQNLAIYGGLCIGATPALSLALAPSSDFGGLVMAALTGTPLPPAGSGTPSPSATRLLPAALPALRRA